MSESGKITASHLSRAAVIYVRQSTLAQVERNTESTARQYDLVHRARQLGWPRDAVRVIDGDLGVSGSVTGQRDGFEGMVAEVALGQVVLAGRGLGVVLHLGEGGLADVDDRGPRQVRGGDLIAHRRPPSRPASWRSGPPAARRPS